MNTPDEDIRIAWANGTPEALHHAAERLAAAGCEEASILNALEKLLLEIRVAGADDATEDRITDVMERFTDWCREENRIRVNRTRPPVQPAPNVDQPAPSIR